MAREDVLVVGAGVIGASVAWHLARRGATVRVIDHAPRIGAGSTPRATGGYRAQFGTEINVHLSLLSLGKLKRFQREVGADPKYRPAGYLFVARTESELKRLRDAQAIQRRAGLTDVRPLSAQEVLDRNPHLATDGILGGAFGPSDGFLDPLAILHGYRAAAERLGVRFDWGVPYGRAQAAPLVVNAAGAWAASVGPVPVRAVRRQVLPTVQTKALGEALPLTAYLGDAFHFRVRDGRVLLLWPGGRQVVGPGPLQVDPQWMDQVEQTFRERVPGLGAVAMDRAAAWAGYYDMSPDEHAILGRVGNMVFANGSSGHGVMHAPAIGQIVSEIALDGKSKVLDVHALRPSRFDEGEPVRGVEVF